MAAMPDTVQCSTWCWLCLVAEQMLNLCGFYRQPSQLMLLHLSKCAMCFNCIMQFGRRMAHTMVHMNKRLTFASEHVIKQIFLAITWKDLEFVYQNKN